MGIKLTQLSLKYVKGFQEIDLHFHKRLTVLIGDNGSGKTSIMDALSIILGKILMKFIDQDKSRAIEKNLTYIYSEHEYQNIDETWHNLQYNKEHTAIDLAFNLNEKKYTAILDRVQLGPGHTIQLNKGFIAEDFEYEDSDRTFLPLFIYYPAYKMPIGFYEFSKSNEAIDPDKSFLLAYLSALSSQPFDMNIFLEWFQWQENIAGQTGKNHILKVIKKAIYKLLSDKKNKFDNLYINWLHSSAGDLCIHKNDISLSINQLSSGEKSLLVLVADLARRLAMANPTQQNPLQCSAVVLIDEIDLHLHPSWQRMIIPKLMEIFSNCQFIITTHSPQILSSIEAGKVWRIENFELEAENNTYGQTSNAILADILGDRERPEEIQGKFREIYQAIDNNDFAKAKDKLSQLEDAIGIDETGIVEAKTHLTFIESCV
ncbi:AAA family ATPase [Candidatus Venteria ishoeyi]|uniref:Recombination protein F n=1 Tax=Candidatus Venteria ishoeyi TaxID=1899563 RepID=A0A1H6F6S2_9GAMM|nr:AAA family ATPase [Candidatus Venteria ishoeyi]SEH04685.1 recombination protein F [Candidatus Venteria ishoeyi]